MQPPQVGQNYTLVSTFGKSGKGKFIESKFIVANLEGVFEKEKIRLYFQTESFGTSGNSTNLIFKLIKFESLKYQFKIRDLRKNFKIFKSAKNLLKTSKNRILNCIQPIFRKSRFTLFFRIESN